MGIRLVSARYHLTAKQDSDLPASNEDRKKKAKREKEAKKKKEMKVRKIEVTPCKLRCIMSPVSNTSAIFLSKNKQQG